MVCCEHVNETYLTMIGGILGGLSFLGSLYGGLKSAQSNNAIDSKLAGQRSELQTWYDKEYNQNYMDTDEAKSTLQVLRNQMGQRMKAVDQNNAIRGASDEARVATVDKLQQGYSNAATQLAGYGTRKKEYANRLYQSLLQGQNAQELGQLQNKAGQWGNFMNNAANMGIGAAEAGGDGAFEDWDNKLTSLWKKKPSAGVVRAYQDRGIF